MESKLEKIRRERKQIIEDYSNKKMEDLHIDSEVKKIKDLQHVLVKEIVEETPDTKSFLLVPDKDKGTKELAIFKAGEYVSLKLKIDKAFVSRAYSLSSSPKEALNGVYRLTIKRVEDGLVSNYMLDEIKVDDTLCLSKPVGEFTYNHIRDEDNVIAIAGGSGITPFMSLAKAIEEGSEDCNLTVFYSVKTEDDIIFKKEIEDINKKSKKVHFVITLTQEEKEGYLHGYITKEMLKDYIQEFNTIFMCGPKGLYKTMNEILAYYHIPKKNVHYENFTVEYEPSVIKTYKLKVLMKDEVKIISCKSNESLLISMEKEGIKAPAMCRVGVCGFCRSILIEGKIKMIGASQLKALSDNDYIHPCVTYPESDVVIRLDV